jgi:hypothetical protein
MKATELIKHIQDWIAVNRGEDMEILVRVGGHNEYRKVTAVGMDNSSKEAYKLPTNFIALQIDIPIPAGYQESR